MVLDALAMWCDDDVTMLEHHQTLLRLPGTANLNIIGLMVPIATISVGIATLSGRCNSHAVATAVTCGQQRRSALICKVHSPFRLQSGVEFFAMNIEQKQCHR